MTTMETATLSVTIDAPVREVADDLADPIRHPQWATEFFSGSAESIGSDEVRVTVPRMGGAARMRIEAEPAAGIVDLYLAPEGAPFGPPLPVRVVPNLDGCDVLFTLARFPGQSQEAWEEGLASMRRELDGLRRRFEG